MTVTLSPERRPLFRRGRAVPVDAAELARRDEAIHALRSRLDYLQTALDFEKRERVTLELEVRELRAFRAESDRLTAALAAALHEQQAALEALEHTLGG